MGYGGLAYWQKIEIVAIYLQTSPYGGGVWKHLSEDQKNEFRKKARLLMEGKPVDGIDDCASVIKNVEAITDVFDY